MELRKTTINRDKHKDIYTNLKKTKGNTKIVLDSQQRLIDKYIFITEQLNSRPATGSQRPVTAGGFRKHSRRSSNIVI